jgi:CubicO group peptidase (beta-lactamase class C family)
MSAAAPAFLVAALLLVAAPARAEDCAAPADRQDGWAVAAPEAAGLDPKPVGPHFAAWKAANLHAVAVARGGKLVYEHYLSGEDEIWGRAVGRVAFAWDTRHDLRSVTKSITALVAGIAFDRGWLKDLDAPVFSFFPEYAELRTPQKERITLRHLLTMTAGFAWDESPAYGNPANSERGMDAAPDPVRHVLMQKMAAEPGAAYNYCGCAAVLLEAILKKVTGSPLDLLAKDYLFAPLGITDVEWTRFGNGEVLGHGGLRLRARDLLKIGQLVLDRGAWQGRQIVSRDWIAQATAPQINGEGLYFYGYQWWLGRSLVQRREIDWIAGVGSGQRLYIVPAEHLAAVVYAGLYASPLQARVGAAVLNDHLLAALPRH